jgi:hypothetical protein
MDPAALHVSVTHDRSTAERQEDLLFVIFGVVGAGSLRLSEVASGSTDLGDSDSSVISIILPVYS